MVLVLVIVAVWAAQVVPWLVYESLREALMVRWLVSVGFGTFLAILGLP